MNNARQASHSGVDFPYTDKTTCVIEIHTDGTVSQGGGAEPLRRARDGESRLFAVWPGEWRSDLFAIDDLDEYARALGILPDPERTGLQDHEHDVAWELCKYGNSSPKAAWITIDVELHCGCVVADLDTFAKHMNEQRGWNVATSSGSGSSHNVLTGKRTYSMRVRRLSL